MCSHLHTRKPFDGAVLLWTSWVRASLCRKGDGDCPYDSLPGGRAWPQGVTAWPAPWMSHQH